jgi:hypothetical protein
LVEHLLCKQGVIGSNPIVSRLKARALPWTRQRTVVLWTPLNGVRGQWPLWGRRGEAPGPGCFMGEGRWIGAVSAVRRVCSLVL